MEWRPRDVTLLRCRAAGDSDYSAYVALAAAAAAAAAKYLLDFERTDGRLQTRGRRTDGRTLVKRARPGDEGARPG